LSTERVHCFTVFKAAAPSEFLTKYLSCGKCQIARSVL